MLDQRTRGLIYEQIRSRPGLWHQQLRADLGLASGTLNHHLHTLERERLIQRRRSGLRLRFYPEEAGTEAAPQPAGTLAPLPQELVRLLQRRAGLSQSEAARMLGASRQALHYHVDALRAAGLLWAERQGRETVLSLAPEAARRFGRCPHCAGLFVLEAATSDAVACPYCQKSIRRRAGG